MSAFRSLADLPLLAIWDGVRARTVEGRELTFAVVELDPLGTVAEHQHPNEQIGMVVQGTLTFTIGGETRELVAGDMYNIPANVAHDARAGAGGAVAIDVFAPVRADWNRFARQAPARPVWP